MKLFNMQNFIYKLAKNSAVIGGVVLTSLALAMVMSIIGGSISKFAYSEFAKNYTSGLATFIQNTGIRTIPGMYEVMKIGIAFVVFSFLPITSLERGHAVVDVFTNFLPERSNQILIAFWEIIFFIVLAIITWRIFHGMERFISTGVILQELKIPEWYGYAVAFLQMLIASFVSGYVAFGQVVKATIGKDILPKTEGALQ